VWTTHNIFSSLFSTNASSTNASTTNLAITSLGTPAGAFLAVNPAGVVIATTTPSGSGTITGTGIAGLLAAWTSSSALTSTSSPTAFSYTATSTSQASVFPYASTTALSSTNLYASKNATIGDITANGESVYLFPHFRSEDEKAFLLSSNNGIEFAKAASSTVYTAPVGTVRDPSITKVNNVYWMAYTSGGFTSANSFGVASSTNLSDWSHVTQVDVSAISGTGNVWAPEWFNDPDTGITHIFFASNKSGSYKMYEVHPTNAQFTTWSTPVLVTGTGFPGMIDAFVVKKNGIYNLWYVATSTPAYIEYATSTSLTSGYNIAESGDWAGWDGNVEGESLVQVDSDTWRIYMDDYSGVDEEYYYSESNDDWATWSDRTQIWAAGGAGYVRHGTVIKLNDFNSLRNVSMATAQAFGSSNLFFMGDYVGIGTSTPKTGLHIVGANGLVVEGLGNNSPGVGRVTPGGGNSTAVFEAYRTGGQGNWGNPSNYERLVFGFNQYIGIGSNAYIGVDNDGTGTLRNLLFTMAGVEKMRLTTAGLLGIGTSTPGTLLSLGDTGNSTINITPTATSTFGLGINLRGGCYAINGDCITSGAAQTSNGHATSTGDAAIYNISVDANDTLQVWYETHRNRDNTCTPTDFGVDFILKQSTYSASSTLSSMGTNNGSDGGCSLSFFTLFTATTTETINLITDQTNGQYSSVMYTLFKR